MVLELELGCCCCFRALFTRHWRLARDASRESMKEWGGEEEERRGGKKGKVVEVEVGVEVGGKGANPEDTNSPTARGSMPPKFPYWWGVERLVNSEVARKLESKDWVHTPPPPPLQLPWVVESQDTENKSPRHVPSSVPFTVSPSLGGVLPGQKHPQDGGKERDEDGGGRGGRGEWGVGKGGS